MTNTETEATNTRSRETETFTGVILRGPDFQPVEGRLVVEDDEIGAIEETTTESDDILIPAFVNAHTHVGDAIAKEAGGGLSLEELVAPPGGLKHRLLVEATDEEKIIAMRRTLSYMQQGGTAAFVDFREGGIDGVNALREAEKGLSIRPVIYGRDEEGVLGIADGFGASGARDKDMTEKRVAARKAGKPFAIHAGEGDASDIEEALDLDPDHLVHMVHAEPHHLERVESAAIPVVVCPRSNLVTGVGLPDISTLLDHTTVALGTDNVMLNGPSMFREMEFAAKVAGLPARSVLRMATKAAATVADIGGGIIAEGEPARLVVIDGDSDNLAGYQDPVRAVVRRAGVMDVKAVHP